MSNFKYEKLFQYGKDITEYDKLDSDKIKVTNIHGKKIIHITKTILEELAKVAF